MIIYTMVLTAEELSDNYYFACAFVAGPPYNYTRKDFNCKDDGLSTGPRPYIGVWTVDGIAKPTDEEMMANLTAFNIATVRDTIS